MKIAIDRHIATGDLAGLDRIALAFLAILLASFALEYTPDRVLQMTGQRIMFDMRMEIYRICSGSTCSSTIAIRSAV